MNFDDRSVHRHVEKGLKTGTDGGVCCHPVAGGLNCDYSSGSLYVSDETVAATKSAIRFMHAVLNIIVVKKKRAQYIFKEFA